MDEIFTPGEQKLIMMSILCNPEGLTNMKIDYNKLAEKAGFKNGESARVTFGKARRKLIEYAGEDGSAPNKTPSPAKSSPNKVTKRAGKAGGTPAKGKGESKKKAKNVKEEPVVDDLVDEANGGADDVETPSQVNPKNEEE